MSLDKFWTEYTALTTHDVPQKYNKQFVAIQDIDLALSLIEKHKLEILGFEGFNIEGDFIIPDMECIADYSGITDQAQVRASASDILGGKTESEYVEFVFNDGLEAQKLMNDTEYLLQKLNFDYTSSENSRGKEYVVELDEILWELTIGSKWIGYEIMLRKGVLGKEIGTYEDTDNYPIDGDYSEISLKIFNNALGCLKGIHDNKVYAGFYQGTPTMAVPQFDGTYKRIKRNRFTMQSEIVSAEDINSWEEKKAISY